jgi:hypothetical protein
VCKNATYAQNFLTLCYIYNNIVLFLFGFKGHKHNLGHMAPKQGRCFWLTSGVTNLKQHQVYKQSRLLEVRDAQTPVI